MKQSLISVTLLSSYLYCPRKLFLERVLQLAEPPKDVLVKGTIRHAVYDTINIKEESLVKSIAEKETYLDILAKYKKSYSEILKYTVLRNKDLLKGVNIRPLELFKATWPLILEESKTRSLNLWSFIKEKQIYGSDLWEQLTPKIKSEFRIESPKLQLKGIIDQIEVYPTGYVPIELKTGKPPFDGVWPGHKIQVAAYAMLIEEHFNLTVKEGFVRYLDTQERRQVIIIPFLKHEVNELVKKVSDLLNSFDVPAILEEKNKCKPCGLKETCYNRQDIIDEKINVIKAQQ